MSDPGSVETGADDGPEVADDLGTVVDDPGATDEVDPAADAGRAGAVLAYLAANLVDTPEEVSIEAQPSRNGGVRLSLRVAADDMGRVIGRRGRIAQSIRGVVRAAGAGDGRDISVDIVDS